MTSTKVEILVATLFIVTSHVLGNIRKKVAQKRVDFSTFSYSKGELATRLRRDAQGELHDAKHGVKMGIPNGGCDDGKTKLEVDWDGSFVNYTCLNPTKPIIPDENIPSKLHCDNVSNDYSPSKLLP